MYSVFDYGKMIADSVRMKAYAQALRQTVRPDCAVLDIGTGTGIFALLACQLGARRVYAVEPSDAIEVARQVAAENGYSGRIEFFQALSSEVTLPERVDVIVSDLRGVLPLLGHHLPAIVDARTRFLAPNGRLIPQRDVIWAAVAEAPKLYQPYVDVWESNPYGFQMRAAQSIVTNTWRKGRVAPEQLLVAPKQWATLEYSTVQSPNVCSELCWTAAKPATGHGICVWFDATLAEGAGFSNGPGAPELIYGSAFFPWATPVELGPQDTVTVMLQADLVEDDYLWRWDTTVLEGGQPERVKASFKQSTFYGVPLSLAQLRKQAATHVPTLNDEGEIERFILGQMDGHTALEEIARGLVDAFPARFETWSAALSRASDVSKRFSR